MEAGHLRDLGPRPPAGALGALTAEGPLPVVTFRHLGRDDLPLVGRWHDEAHVARWWTDPHAPADLEARYGPAIDGHDAAEVFVVEADGEPIGMVQRVWLAREPRWAAALGVASDADLDYLIGAPRFLRRGIGAAMLAAFVDETFRTHPSVHALSSAPQQANVASWRALERAGFVRARVVAQLASDDPGDAGPAYVYLRRRRDNADHRRRGVS